MGRRTVLAGYLRTATRLIIRRIYYAVEEALEHVHGLPEWKAQEEVPMKPVMMG